MRTAGAARCGRWRSNHGVRDRPARGRLYQRQRGAAGARDAFTTSDFIPGEYTKLYVPNTEHFRAQSIIEGMRSGNSYSVNADLIGPDMVFRAKTRGDDWKTMGETLVVRPGEKITVEMELTVPNENNLDHIEHPLYNRYTGFTGRDHR